MSRRKGSKNRSTLVKELVERGAVESDLADMTYPELEERANHALSERPAPPPVEQRVLIDPEEASDIVKRCKARLVEMCEYFAPDGVDKSGHPVTVPIDLRSRLRHCYVARTTAAARQVAKGVLDTQFLRLKWRQRRGTIAGPARGDVRIWVV